jgi:hypothetical protein
MSLLAELQSRGVTTEDLEKAASVRLFEKAAAAEGVNLDDLREDQVISLFEQFVSAPTSSTKEASAMNDEIVDLFEKTAAAEGIDLDEMSDEDLAELYEHYVENVLPAQVEGADEDLEKEAAADILGLFEKTAADEGIDLDELDEDEIVELYEHYVENVLPLQIGDEDAEEKVADAQEKLAEAEILGRHMARAYADEMDKVASMKDRIGEEYRKFRGKSTLKDRARRFGRSYKSALKAEQFRQGNTDRKSRLTELASKMGIKRPRKDARKNMLRGGLKTLGAYGAPAALLGGGAYLASKHMSKKSSAFDEIEFDDDVLDALSIIEDEFGEDVAEDVAGDVAEKVASLSKRYRANRDLGAPKAESFVDAAGDTMRSKAVRGTTLLTGSLFNQMSGKKGPGVLRAAYGKGHKKGLIFNRKGKVDKELVREARKVLAARGAVGLAGLGAAGYAGKKLLEKKSSDSAADLAVEMLLDAGYDI